MKTKIINAVCKVRFLAVLLLLTFAYASAWATDCQLKVWDKSKNAYTRFLCWHNEITKYWNDKLGKVDKLYLVLFPVQLVPFFLSLVLFQLFSLFQYVKDLFCNLFRVPYSSTIFKVRTRTRKYAQESILLCNVQLFIYTSL